MNTIPAAKNWRLLGVKSANTVVNLEKCPSSEIRRETEEIRKLDNFKAKRINYGSASYKL